MGEIIKYSNSNNLIADICQIIDEARSYAYKMVDAALVLRNWYIGKRIDEEVFAGKERAQYGAEVITRLSRELTGIYGKGFSKRALYQCLRVYRMFPEIVHEARAQLGSNEKCTNLVHNPDCYHGPIIGFLLRLRIKKQENGMQKRLMIKCGLRQPCREMCRLSTISEY